MVRTETEGDVGAQTLVALSKDGEELLGTLRMRSSLTTDVTLDMPALWHEIGDRAFIYTDRFAATPGPLADMVMLALTKAQWFFAYEQGVEWITGICVAGLVRRYRQVGLRLMRTLDGIDHFVRDYAPGVKWYGVGESLVDMPLGLLTTRPSLATFMFDVEHPDLCFPRPAALDAHVRAARARHAALTPECSESAR